jgi:hypothetical protein
LIRLGELDFDDNSEEADPEDFEIEARLPHPDYDNKTYLHDIILYRLAKDVQFSKFKIPACLQPRAVIAYRIATAAGWGRQGSGNY